MNALVKNWRFLVVLVVCLGVWFFVSGSVATAQKDAGNALSRAQNAMDSFVRNVKTDSDPAKFGRPANVELAFLTAQEQLIEGLLARQARLIGWQRSPEFDYEASGVAGTVNARRDFYRQRLENLDDRLGYARYWRPRLKDPTSIGRDLNPRDDAQPAELRFNLLFLDIISRVATSAEKAGVPRIDSFSFVDRDNLHNLIKRLPSVRKDRTALVQGDGKPPLLSPLGVRITLQGSLPAVFAMLKDLTGGDAMDSGRSLSLEEFEITKPDWKAPVDDTILFTGQLVAYTVNLEAELPMDSLLAIDQRIKREKLGVSVGDEGGDSFDQGGDSVVPSGRRPR